MNLNERCVSSFPVVLREDSTCYGGRKEHVQLKGDSWNVGLVDIRR